MSDPTGPGGPDGGTGAAPGQPAARSINLAAVAGAIVLIGLVAFALYRKSATNPVPEETPAADAAASQADASGQGTPIAAASVSLTPEAQIASERYRCICSCNDPLSVCTCTRTPGSIDMKEYVQELVNQNKTPGEIDAAMVARYGEAALLKNPAPKAAPGAPATPPAR
ncbi:MAG: cytochrome c-type biogenesis protein CcmH [Candidatus Polarisedimenticolia bacterium]